MEHHPAAKFGPLCGWECKRQLRLLDILDYWCCLPPCRSLAHPHTGCNPRPCFPPPNLTVFWVNLRSMRAPVGLLQYLRWLMQFNRRLIWEIHLPPATFPASILLAGCGPFLIAFCSVLVSGHWFDHGGHFETEFDTPFWLTRGLQVTRSRGALLQWKRGWPWIFEPTKGPPRVVVLRGLPDLGLSKTSPVSSYLFLILCTWSWETLKASATSAVDLVFSLLIISALVSGWILGMLSEVKLMWRSGVLGFFLYTPKNWLINLGLGASYDKATRLLPLQKLTQWALPTCEH